MLIALEIPHLCLLKFGKTQQAITVVGISFHRQTGYTSHSNLVQEGSATSVTNFGSAGNAGKKKEQCSAQYLTGGKEE